MQNLSINVITLIKIDRNPPSKVCYNFFHIKIHPMSTVTCCVINEFNPTFETQNMGNEAFENASFGNASFGNGNEDYSCLWA